MKAVSENLSRAVRRVAYAALSRALARDLQRPSSCRMHGLVLRIEPGVLHPRHFRSSQLLAEELLRRPLDGRRVIDVGTGSGVLALAAARAGATAVGVDITDIAVRCAAANAVANGLEERTDFRRSDVFDALLPSECFDLVVSNPPFYPRNAHLEEDHPFAAGEGHHFMRKFISGLDLHLHPDGEVLMVHSSDVDFAPLETAFADAGFAMRVEASHRGLFETLTVRSFRRLPATTR